MSTPHAITAQRRMAALFDRFTTALSDAGPAG